MEKVLTDKEIRELESLDDLDDELENNTEYVEIEKDVEENISKEVTKISKEETLLDSIGVNLENWVSGSEGVPNKDIQTFLNSTADKAKIINSYVIMSNMARISKINNFINNVENDLFNVDNLEYMSPKDKMNIYRLAIQRTQEIVNMNDGYIKSTEGTVDEETQRLLTIIKTLSPEQIQNLISLVRGNKTDNDENGGK